jgi:hypothetical protein
MSKSQQTSEETRIYVAVAATIQVPVVANSHKPPLRTVVQPAGRQIAQACHVVSKLRHDQKLPNEGMFVLASDNKFQAVTTIILQARDSAELSHIWSLAFHRRLNPIIFSDDNPEYGPGSWPTAVAMFATPKQTKRILDYLPLWSGK